MAFQPREKGRQSAELELFAGKVAIVITFAIVLALLWAARAVLILVFIAAVIAAGIAPAVHRLRVLARFWFQWAAPMAANLLLETTGGNNNAQRDDWRGRATGDRAS